MELLELIWSWTLRFLLKPKGVLEFEIEGSVICHVMKTFPLRYLGI
jgi:hypothetical protein